MRQPTQLLDIVALIADLPAEGLLRGQVVTVVMAPPRMSGSSQ